MASQPPAPERQPFEESKEDESQSHNETVLKHEGTSNRQDYDMFAESTPSASPALDTADATNSASIAVDLAPAPTSLTATAPEDEHKDTIAARLESENSASIAPTTATDYIPEMKDHASQQSALLPTAQPDPVDHAASTVEPAKTEPDPIATISVPPPIEQPTSDVRDEPVAEQVALEEAPVVKPDLAFDGVPDAMDTTEDVAKQTATEEPATNGTANRSYPSLSESVPPVTESPQMDDSAQSTTANTSMMDTQPTDVSEKLQVNEPASSSAPPDTATGTDMDATMTDVPAPSKVRAREDEDDAEPAAKRAKTDEGSAPVPPQSSDAQKLDVPVAEQPATPSPAPATNGTPQAGPAPPAATPSFADEIMAKRDFDSNPISDAQHRYLQESLRKAKKIKAGASFAEPVDPVKLNIPTYFEFIKRPMDLTTIEKKLREREYSSTNDLMDDFDTMVRNCMTFNGPNHAVTLSGYDLKAYFIKLLNVMPKSGDPLPAPKKLLKPPTAPTRLSQPRRESRTKSSPPAPPAPAVVPTAMPPPSGSAGSPPASTAFALKPDGLPLIRRDSAATDRPKREIHRPPSKDLIYNQPKPKGRKAVELQFAEQVVNEFYKPKYEAVAASFYYEVDPVALQIPTYHKVIKKPMDLGSIRRNVEQGHYHNAKDVYRDFKLMLSNCYKFNGPDHPISFAGKQLEKYFEDEWSKLDDYVSKNTPASPTEVDLSDEEEEEESDVEDSGVWMKRQMDELNAVQAELQALAKRQFDLQNRHGDLLKEIQEGQLKGKAVSPKVGGKKSKTKKPKLEGGSKGGKRGSGVGVAKDDTKKKGGAAAKPKKIPTLGLPQKTEISNYIDTLTDNDRVQEVLGIIRAGMPSVANLDTQEIELDIDQIPNHVLYDLYVYICKSRGEKPNFGTSTGRASTVDDGAYDRDLEDADFQPRKKSGGGRRGRKGGSGGTGDDSAAAAQRKKNKPMKPAEQEARISEIKQALGGFSGNGGAGHGVVESVEGIGHDEDSEDDSDDESESEEE
ncbi:hypothetical protein P152DRAFT_450385 [Eremomyces bilateralis CBS 781.70]|uniref:Bromodomain-containing protein n=1 Tax=Eremomyces bilateralis CBS 781.70 TaxID=1392243 RepID=A0A6G1FZK9_9PEZI|nr:uncharacterized protein P152DRAFT_450385 [Eremomyces bilateralis CBS 781.70]KAF1811233.1 hypothetical protein P152DRAFT_450385 [Eremomyces bilateralis CBS 781.70]